MRRLVGLWKDQPSTKNRFRTIISVLLVACATVCSMAAVAFAQGPAAAAVETSPPIPLWSVTRSPNPSPSTSIRRNTLLGVACMSASSCVAVGSYDKAHTGQTLVESWSGSGGKWTVISSPDAGTDNQLNAVSCTSSTNCIAVGDYNNGTNEQTLALSWNGTAWSTVASPNQAGSDNALDGVSCTGPSSCTAVGEYGPSGGNSQTLVEAWDGTEWSIVASPNPAVDSILDAVSCGGPNNCQAVGYYTDQSQPYQNLVESWDGIEWSIVASPVVGTGDNSLLGVSCISPTNCTAVGSYTGTSEQGWPDTLVESWDGTAWSVVPSQDPNFDDSLTAVSCTNTTSCVAVGDYYGTSNGGSPDTLIESWDGSAWSDSLSPPSNNWTYLNGVSCTGTSNCVGVGYSFVFPDATKTLVETNLVAISSFSPPYGAPGTVVTIHGANLEDATGVTFNGVAATMITKDKPKRMFVEVPAGATSGKIEVTTSQGTATSRATFTVK